MLPTLQVLTMLVVIAAAKGGELEVITLQSNEYDSKFEGSYTSFDGNRIHMMSTYSHDPSSMQIHISIPGGDTVFEFYKPHEKPVHIVSIMNNHFLYADGKKYVVTSKRHLFKAAIQAGVTSGLTENLETIDHTQINSLPELLIDHKLSETMEEARSGLDDIEYSEPNSAVLNLYNALHQLSKNKARKLFLKTVEAQDIDYCSHVPTHPTCWPPKKCACMDGECYGLCGANCNCRGVWAFACEKGNDCCFHIGCFGHDRCCAKSTFDFACINTTLLNGHCDEPWPFPCAMEEDDPQDPFYEQTYTINGEPCVGNPCGLHGDEYWCYTDMAKEMWGYCCKPGEKCRSRNRPTRTCPYNTSGSMTECKKPPSHPNVPAICSNVRHPSSIFAKN